MKPEWNDIQSPQQKVQKIRYIYSHDSEEETDA